jgi:hypothetical protein
MEIWMAAETCTGRSEFSDIIHPEFVIDANKNRSGENDNILSCVWLNHLPCSSISLPYHCSSFFLVKSLAETTTTIFVEKSKNCWNIRSDFGKHSQLIKQGNPNVYLLNAKEDSTGGDFRGMGTAGRGKSTLTDGESRSLPFNWPSLNGQLHPGGWV